MKMWKPEEFCITPHLEGRGEKKDQKGLMLLCYAKTMERGITLSRNMKNALEKPR